jgi:hypothetical protein
MLSWITIFNPSAWHQLFQSIMGYGTHRPPIPTSITVSTSITSDSVETKNLQSISSLFNTFLTSIGQTLANKIKQKLSSNIFSSIELPQFNSTFEFKEIDVTSLKINKSTGLDGVGNVLALPLLLC